jgi:ATP-dependent RNA helicase DeaD
VREARERELLREVREVLEAGKYKGFYPAVGELCEEYEPEEVAAATLSMVSGGLEVEHIEETGARHAGRSGMRRLFLTIGRKDRIKVGDMVRAISEKSSIPGRNIGRIDLFDSYSFVEVPEDMAEQVIGSINDMMISGKRVKVKKATDKKGSGRKTRNSRKAGGRKPDSRNSKKRKRA